MPQIRWIRRADHVEQMWEIRNAYGLLMGKPEEGRPQRTSRHMWMDNIRMDFMEIGSDMEWIDLAQDRNKQRASSVMNLRFH
jgi:hypothetical protein